MAFLTSMSVPVPKRQGKEECLVRKVSALIREDKGVLCMCLGNKEVLI